MGFHHMQEISKHKRPDVYYRFHPSKEQPEGSKRILTELESKGREDIEEVNESEYIQSSIESAGLLREPTCLGGDSNYLSNLRGSGG